MYLMYVDESGDCGLTNSPTDYFILSGLVVHELRWQACLTKLVECRKKMRSQYGLKLREEIHAAHLINRPGDLVRIKRHDRLAILRDFADTLAAMPDVSLVNVLVDKRSKTPGYDVFEMAWTALIQRFENTMSYKNFPGPPNPQERGIILPDHTDDKKLMQLLRKLRYFNPVPSNFGGSRMMPLRFIVEDPCHRNSAHSYFIQAVDLSAYLLHQRTKPNSYMRKKGGTNYFDRLKPVLCLHATRADPLAIVRL